MQAGRNLRDMRVRTFVAGLLLTGMALAGPLPDKAQWTHSSTGFAGTSGDTLRVYADGRVERIHFVNGKNTLTGQGLLTGAEAEALLRGVDELKVKNVSRHPQGSHQTLTVTTNGKTRSVPLTNQDALRVRQLFEPATGALPVK